MELVLKPVVPTVKNMPAKSVIFSQRSRLSVAVGFMALEDAILLIYYLEAFDEG